ncbi:L-type lectin-domain containing receptor kinase IX.1-like [Quercus robur]|uniref:L-type lectin-domain containing receptor kinase IX.1-like n=1 Tax=Quercus robur TaxID=38942 RepID=UPI002163FA47|nr:L-type lectin-domain containing receptor kinase IX.1-like [Quercus robur]
MIVDKLTIKHFLFPQLLILFYLFMITNFFSLLTSFTFASAMYFNFTSFSNTDTNIFYERAYPELENQAIQLTGDKLINQVMGRATYFKPMHLWDKTSGNLTDFTTHFSFVIDSQNQPKFADGLAFFLSPNDSKIPMGAYGRVLGLTTQAEALNSVANPFVAVEFDIWSNFEWDPEGEHVGIDINSMKSVANASWFSDITIMEGRINEALISYNSSSYNLSVVFTGFKNNRTIFQTLSHIVDLRNLLPEWVTFGFSAATGAESCVMHTIYTWNFSSSLEIDNNIISPEGPSPALSSKKRNTNRLAVEFSVGGFILVGGSAMILFALWKMNRRHKEDDHALDEEFKKGTGPRRFSYNELAHATNDFNDKEKLGQGGFGGVYRGFLRDSIVAIKRVSDGSRQGIREYASEVKIISQLRHKNLIQLIGWCHERSRGHLLLVYDFMPNGSLDSHLFRNDALLIWEVRYKIVQDLASALFYLHEGWERCVLHRDIKSSNIMLDSNFNAKLGDFGLARLVDHDNASQITDLAGTKGYMDPECVTTRRASKESDIYSFGIVALELACGRKPVDHKAIEDQIVMLDWVRVLYEKGETLSAVDQRLGGCFDEQQMKCLLIVGLWCAHSKCNRRPSIREVVQVLNFEVSLPPLQLDSPGSSNCTPAVNEATSFLSTSNGATDSKG